MRDAIVLPRGDTRERAGERGEWSAAEPDDTERDWRSDEGDYGAPGKFVHARGEESKARRSGRCVR